MSKHSPEIKIKACEDYISGKYSHREICEKYGIHFKRNGTSMLNQWLPLYREHGPTAFLKTDGNRSYSSELKTNAVLDYLSGQGSIVDIAAKYNLRSKTQLQTWVSLYNANRELKDYFPKSEVYMAEARRKTTIEERKKIKGLQPARAEVIAGGAYLVYTIMDYLGIDFITVSESDNLEGYLQIKERNNE